MEFVFSAVFTAVDEEQKMFMVVMMMMMTMMMTAACDHISALFMSRFRQIPPQALPSASDF
jgi:hypothetical protein